MSERAGDLDVPEDPDFERRNHLVQRIGWMSMAALVVVALLGGFGRGMLASASATSDRGTIRLDYDRVTRHGSPSRLVLTLAGSAAAEGRAQVAMSRRLFDEVDLLQVTPEPERAQVGIDHILYDFLVPPGQPARIVLVIEPQGYNWHEGRVTVPLTGEAVAFRLFVLP